MKARVNREMKPFCPRRVHLQQQHLQRLAKALRSGVRALSSLRTATRYRLYSGLRPLSVMQEAG